jgi:hypothetical protein
MNEPSQVDKTFNIIMKKMVDTGQAPHYTEIASEMNVSMEEGRKALHVLFHLEFPPGCIQIPSTFARFLRSITFPPSTVSLLIVSKSGSVNEDSSRWRFSRLFPGKTVQVDAPCLDCGTPIRVEMKDGVFQNTEPDGLVGYTSVPFRDWFNKLPFA